MKLILSTSEQSHEKLYSQEINCRKYVKCIKIQNWAHNFTSNQTFIIALWAKIEILGIYTKLMFWGTLKGAAVLFKMVKISVLANFEEWISDYQNYQIFHFDIFKRPKRPFWMILFLPNSIFGQDPILKMVQNWLLKYFIHTKLTKPSFWHFWKAKNTILNNFAMDWIRLIRFGSLYTLQIQ